MKSHVVSSRAFLAALALAGALSPAAAKPRIASINMCADQLLLALADPDQIVGLSPYSRDAGLSWHAARAAEHRILSGTAEDILPLKPDIVLTAVFVKPATRAMLKRSRITVIELEPASSVEAAKAQIHLVGDLLDQKQRAGEAIRAIENAEERLQRAASQTRLRVLPLERRGWVSGRSSLTTDMLEKAGLLNLGAESAGRTGGRLDLETIVKLQPDRLLLSDDGAVAEDQGAAFLHHPALARLAPANARLVIPEKMTVCGGPVLVDALDRLADELKRTGAKPQN